MQLIYFLFSCIINICMAIFHCREWTSGRFSSQICVTHIWRAVRVNTHIVPSRPAELWWRLIRMARRNHQRVQGRSGWQRCASGICFSRWRQRAMVSLLVLKTETTLEVISHSILYATENVLANCFILFRHCGVKSRGWCGGMYPSTAPSTATGGICFSWGTNIYIRKVTISTASCNGVSLSIFMQSITAGKWNEQRRMFSCNRESLDDSFNRIERLLAYNREETNGREIHGILMYERYSSILNRSKKTNLIRKRSLTRLFCLRYVEHVYWNLDQSTNSRDEQIVSLRNGDDQRQILLVVPHLRLFCRLICIDIRHCEGRQIQ